MSCFLTSIEYFIANYSLSPNNAGLFALRIVINGDGFAFLFFTELAKKKHPRKQRHEKAVLRVGPVRADHKMAQPFLDADLAV